MFGLEFFVLALPIAAALPKCGRGHKSGPFKADLRVDTNRDGKVDLDGTTDTIGKDTWSESSGALFLANIGDTSRHCKENGYACHDASKDVQWSPEYMAPMRTVPMPDISNTTFGTISISDTVARGQVRIFLDYPEFEPPTKDDPSQVGQLLSGDGDTQALPPIENDRWVYLKNDTPIPAAKLRQGLILGVDARDIRRPNGWDGRVSVEFKVTDGSTTSSDKVMLRVAPVLTHHNLQPIEKVFVTKKNKAAPGIAAIEDGIQKTMQKAGIKEPLQRLAIDFTWAQDVMEPAYASIPGPSGPITMRINMAAEPVIVGGRLDLGSDLLWGDLRSGGVGAVNTGKSLEDIKLADRRLQNLEAGGNVETIPPYEMGGKKYPVGRAIIGATAGKTPRVIEFLKAQEVQEPITVDPTWLFVGHVDEMLGFLPAKSARGWRVTALDPMMGYEALEKLDKDGHGDVPLTSNPTAQNGSSVPSIHDFLADESTKKAATHGAEKMKEALDTLRTETGITDEDIIRIPSVIAPMSALQTWLKVRTNKGGKKPGDKNTDNAFLPLNSAFPSQVNGVVLSDSVFMAPKPWGPVVDGQDMIEKMSTDAYTAAGFQVDFVDEWDLHLASGDLHCYTNTYRTPAEKWW